MLRFLASLWLLGILPAAVSGQIPLQLNHQGVVRVNGVAFDGNGDFRFALVDPDTGDNLWTNDGTQVPGPGTPTNAVNLLVINGIYNVRLGDAILPNMTSVSSTVFNDDNVVLRIWFDDTQGNGVGQLTPDHVLTSAPYAFHSATSDFATTAEDSDTLDGVHHADISLEIDTDIGTHTVASSAHHTRYSNGEAVAAFLAEAGSQIGDLFVHGASGLARLPPGDSGRFLQSQGLGIVPSWALPGSGAAVPVGGIIMWSGSIAAIPAGWVLCNGANGTPDLRDRFIVGAAGEHAVGATGGEKEHTLTIAEMPSHNHTVQINDATSTGPTRKIETAGITNTYGLPTSFAGGNQPHENRPPYYALAYIMRL